MLQPEFVINTSCKTQNWTMWRVFPTPQNTYWGHLILMFWHSHDGNLNMIVRNRRCASLFTVNNYNKIPFCIWSYLENEELLWGSTIYSLYSLNHEKVLIFSPALSFFPVTLSLSLCFLLMLQARPFGRQANLTSTSSSKFKDSGTVCFLLIQSYSLA